MPGDFAPRGALKRDAPFGWNFPAVAYRVAYSLGGDTDNARNLRLALEMIPDSPLEGSALVGHTKEIQIRLQAVKNTSKEFCRAEPQISLYGSDMSGLGSRIKQRREQLRLSQPQLARLVGGLTYQAIQAIERGGQTKHVVAIARALRVTPDWLETGHGVMELSATEPSTSVRFNGLESNKNIPLNKSEERAIVSDKIEVLGMAECGPDGLALWNGEVVDRVDRPNNLAGVANAYAVFIQGDSMEPRYHPGEIAFIHPGRPVTPLSYVLVQLHAKDGGAPRAFLKRLVKRSGEKVILEQFNPKKTFTLKQAEILSIHRVVGSGEA